jgi:hypothetical protein
MLQGFFPPFSLIVLRPCGEMATNFTQPKEAKTTKFQNLNFLDLNQVLMHFLQYKLLLHLIVLW